MPRQGFFLSHAFIAHRLVFFRDQTTNVLFCLRTNDILITTTIVSLWAIYSKRYANLCYAESSSSRIIFLNFDLERYFVNSTKWLKYRQIIKQSQSKAHDPVARVPLSRSKECMLEFLWNHLSFNLFSKYLKFCNEEVRLYTK